MCGSYDGYDSYDSGGVCPCLQELCFGNGGRGHAGDVPSGGCRECFEQEEDVFVGV